jgi:hypothetical protein
MQPAYVVLLLFSNIKKQILQNVISTRKKITHHAKLADERIHKQRTTAEILYLKPTGYCPTNPYQFMRSDPTHAVNLEQTKSLRIQLVQAMQDPIFLH